MLIGLLSDSHGHAAITGRAVKALVDAGAEMLIHLGDVGSTEVLDELVGHNARVVFGNCDFDDDELGRYAELVGIVVDHPLGSLTIDDKRIIYTHGHLPHAIEQALQEDVDFVLHGHTHEQRDDLENGIRWINPGALFRAPRYTVAVLDPGAGQLRVIEIARS